MLTGAILAGGKSRRYGKNKALEIFQGERLIDRGVESLRPFCDPLLVVVNELSPYYDVHATLVRDVFAHQGPLGGIYTALLFSPHEWVFARATDMPVFVPEMLQMMLGVKEGCDAVVPLHGQYYEPLLALYHRRCIPAIADLLGGPERQIIAFFKRIRVKAIEEKAWRGVDAQGISFRNINTPDDWEGLAWN